MLGKVPLFPWWMLWITVAGSSSRVATHET
jgi:hypothetical protein